MTVRTKSYIAAMGILAGLAGGLAEVFWISIYAVLTDGDAGAVARAVTEAARVGGQQMSPVISGVGIHMALSAMLGIAVALAIHPIAGHLRGIALYLVVTAALIGVWAANFFVVLPSVSPQFVNIVPYHVSLLSKLLFGVTAAGLLQWAQLAQPRLLHARIVRPQARR